MKTVASLSKCLTILFVLCAVQSCQQEAKLTAEQVAAMAAMDSLQAMGDRIRKFNLIDSLRKDSTRAVQKAETLAEEAREKEILTKAPDIVISAEAWEAAYSENEAQADRRFVDKILEVTGIVEKVQSSSGTYTCYLKAGRWGNVTCKFDNEDDAVSLEAGSRVTFIGRATPKWGFPEIVDARLKK